MRSLINRSWLAAVAILLFAVTADAQTAITWASQTNVTVTGTTLAKTGGSGGSPDAGALSTQTLPAGTGGTFTFTTTSTTADSVIGLSNDTATDSFAVMSHAFNFSAGTAEVRESGTYRTETTFVAGDIFSIDVSAAGAVLFKKNGGTLYTSGVTATLPLSLDAALYSAGASITNATYTGPTAPPSGTTWKVCASGCDFTNAQLQTALNTAVGGTTILLQEGFTYVGDYTFPAFSGASALSQITVRTGVNSTGVVQATSRYPADNIRICPSTFNVDWMNCSVLTGSTDMTRIAKLQPASNNAYGLKPANTGSGTPVSYWNFRWLEFVAQSYGGNSIVGITNETVPSSGTTTMLPHHITFDQIVLRGDPVSGQFRGLEINGSYITVTNSFFYDIKAMTEGQVIWANTSVGGLVLTNNYLSGGTETWLTGGGGTQIRRTYTVQAGATSTALPLDSVTDLYVGKDVAVRLNTRTIISNTSASPSVFTTSAAHGLTVGEQIYLSGVTCSGANVYAGQTNASGSGPWPVWTVDTVPSTTTFTLMITEGVRTPLNCGTGGSGGTLTTRASTQITNISSNTVTVSPALPYAPASGASVDTSVVIGQGAANTLRYNVLTRPSSFQTAAIQASATAPSATPSATGGTLAAGTYYYVVQAQRLTAQGVYASAAPTSQVSATTTGTTGSVTISWTAAANASRYLIFGRANGAPTMFWTVTAPTVTFTDTGSTGTSQTGVNSTSKWQVKNTFEWKQGQNITAEYNIIENAWTAGQSGPCFVLTATQQTAQAPSAVIRNFTFRYNVVRKCAQFLQIPGTDAQAAESGRSGAITITDNLFYDANGTLYGAQNGIILGGNGGGPRQHPNRAPYDLTFQRNTFHSPGGTWSRALYMDYCDFAMADSRESTSPNFIWKDNITYAGTGNYVMASTGTTTSFCNAGTTPRRWNTAPNGPLGAGSDVSYNVFAGDTCASYPANVTNSFCPSIATLESSTFTNTTSIAGFAIKTTSPYYTASSTGGHIGADVTLFEPAITNITMTGDNSGGGGGGGTPLSITTTSPLPTAIVGTSYSTTLTATGGTAPYTWALVSGTLPAGLSFNTTTGLLSGIPTTAVAARTLTFRVTDAALTQVSAPFNITVVKLTLRASRYNWSEAATFRRAVAPSNPNDQVLTGDTWFNTSTNTLSVATALGPPILWTTIGGSADLSNLNASNLTSGTVPLARLGSSGTPSGTTFLRGDNTWATPAGGGASGAPAVQTIPFWSGAAQSHTPAVSPGTNAANELAGTRNSRIKMDAENSTQCAINVNLVEGSSVAGNTLKVQYWNGSAWVDAGCSAAIDVAGPVIVEGTFSTLAVGARTQDRIFRAFISTGDSTDTVTIGTVQFRLR